MTTPGSGTGRDFRQHIEVETPEHVVLDLEIAGVGSRLLAAVIDTALIGGLTLVVALLLMVLAEIGLVRVGEVTDCTPKRFAMICKRNMWNGSETRMACLSSLSPMIVATASMEAVVVRPLFSSRMAVSATPAFIT